MYLGIVADNWIFCVVPKVVIFTSAGISENLSNSLMQPLAAIIRSEKAWETQSRLGENLMLKIGKSIEQADPVKDAPAHGRGVGPDVL